MITWNSFLVFAICSVCLWLAGSVLSALKVSDSSISTNPNAKSIASLKTGSKILPSVLYAAGSAIFLAFIVLLWISLERPPMRTMGETRLWYSFFISIIGLAMYLRWGFRWVMPFSTVMAIVFVCINLFKPEIHSKALMPALQSIWFVPHVIVYMFAYSVMGVALLVAIFHCYKLTKSTPISATAQATNSTAAQATKSAAAQATNSIPDTASNSATTTTSLKDDKMKICDILVRIGLGFLTLGIVMGALWAKEAWGDYWAWDPKETWAAATWISYMLYLHSRPHIKDDKYSCALLILSFILLQMCWWGINFLPSAQGISVHTY